MHSPGVLLCGSYGAERSDRASAGSSPSPDWAVLADRARRMLGSATGVIVEEKPRAVALHFRLAPERAPEVQEVAATIASEADAVLRPGRMVIEIAERGPGKADILAELVTSKGVDRLMFAGDDLADLEAFERARDLGLPSVLVAVDSREAPPGLAETADLVCGGPSDLVALLERIRAATSRRRPD